MISVGVRLAAFNLEELASLTRYDEMELEQIGERKTALFAIIPDNDSTFNFVIGMLYTQLFQMLYYQADFVHGGELPVPVHFIMDEFANVALPDEFDKVAFDNAFTTYFCIHYFYRTWHRSKRYIKDSLGVHFG